MANGFCVSLPTPVDIAAGSKPRQATSAVIMMGRRRSSEASRVASRTRCAFESKLVDVADQDDRGFDGDAQQREKSEDAGDAERGVREFESDERADRFGEDDAECDGDRKFEIAVKREENQEDQKDSERTDDIELRFGFEQLAVLAAPIQTIALGKLHGFCDGRLAGVDNAFEVAALDGKLNADVARIVFAIDEGSAGGFLDVGELREAESAGRRAREQEDCRSRGRWSDIAAPCEQRDRKVFRPE